MQAELRLYKEEISMEISYRAANIDDLDDVFRLVECAVKQMEQEKIFQWDSIYPAKEDFRNDIKRKSLYVGVIHDKIAVVYALNEQCDEQYPYALKLYANSGYQKKGVACWRKGKFFLMEKQI